MDSERLARRQRAADAHDEALRRWPDRSGPEFEAVLDGTISEFDALLRSMPAASDLTVAESVEWAKTLRWLGDARFDRGRGRDRALLQSGKDAYEAADRLLADHDPLERAKLWINWANTLRGLAGAEDIDLAEKALDKYQCARALMQRHDPSRLPMLEALISGLDGMLGLMRARHRLVRPAPLRSESATHADPAGLQETLAATNVDIALHAKGAMRASETLAAEAGVQLDDSEIDALLSKLKAGARSGSNDGLRAMLDLLRGRYERDVAAGIIEPARARTLCALLRDLEVVMEIDADDVPGIAARLVRLKELLTRLFALMDRPSTGLPEPVAGSRARAVLEHWTTLHRRLAELASRSGEAGRVRQRVMDALAESAGLRRELYLAGDDDSATRRLERDDLRGFARRARHMAGIYNLTLVRPVFEGGPVEPRSDRVFWSGPTEGRALLDGACDRVGLRPAENPRGEEYARSRWQQLRESSVAVFHFANHGPEVGRAAVSYEFGLARALGVPVVLLHDGQGLPFDVAIAAVELHGDDRDEERVAQALDAAVYFVPNETADASGVVATANEAIARHGHGDPGTGVPALLRDLAAELDPPDPIGIEERLHAALLQLGDHRVQLGRPAWPARYPARGETRLFHVMPFRPQWSRRVSEHVANACAPHTYRRHDAVEDPRIIDSLWQEICEASHVLVDLTGLNDNVLVELGFADALGRPVLLVAQQGTVEAGLFPSIAKRRVEEYSVADPEDLTHSVQRFLRIAPPARRPSAWADAGRVGEVGGQTAPVRPGLVAIRAQFEGGLAADPTSDGLATLMRGSPLGAQLPAHAFGPLVQAVRAYVESVPAFLESLWVQAVARGVADPVGAALVQVEAYCGHPDDLFPDHLGIAGLVDDAYLARQVALGVWWQTLANEPSPQIRQIEMVMRNMVIGEPFATQLDGWAAQILLGQPTITAALVASNVAPGWPRPEELGVGPFESILRQSLAEHGLSL